MCTNHLDKWIRQNWRYFSFPIPHTSGCKIDPLKRPLYINTLEWTSDTCITYTKRNLTNFIALSYVRFTKIVIWCHGNTIPRSYPFYDKSSNLILHVLPQQYAPLLAFRNLNGLSHTRWNNLNPDKSSKVKFIRQLFDSWHNCETNNSLLIYT